MKQKIDKLQKAAAKIFGDEADYIIIAHQDGPCGGVTHGRTEYIAQALFALLHQQDNELSQVVYRIIKMNVLNILSNPSPYAVDLARSINNVISKTNEQ